MTNALQNWTAADPLPVDIAEAVPSALAMVERELEPADQKAFYCAMDKLLAWIEQFGVIALASEPARRKEQMRAIIASYRAALSDLPSDLLLIAIDRTTAQHRFRNLPLPGDIRAAVEGELMERKRLRDRLRTVELMAQYRATEEQARFKRRASEAEKAEVERVVRESRRRTAAEDNDGFEPCADVRDAYRVLRGTPFVRRNPAQPCATPVNPTAETADAPADENH